MSRDPGPPGCSRQGDAGWPVRRWSEAGAARRDCGVRISRAATLGRLLDGRRTLGPVTANREIDDILQRGADSGRITPEEALLLY
ncbi:MAG TPA: hypothetical protein VF462_17555, partial [Micromonosporaceae bacterium]